MADIVNNPNDQNQQNQQGQNPQTSEPINVGGAGGAAPNSGTGGVGSVNTTGNSGQSTGVTGYTNTNDAAAANPTQSFGNISSYLGNENANVGNLMNGAYNNFLTNAGTAPTYNQGTFNNAIDNSNTTDQGTLKNWLTASYTGPSTWDTSSISTPYNQYNSDVAGMNNSTGLYNWLTTKAGENPGQAQLDTASYLQNPDYNTTWQGWNTANQNTQNQYNNFGQQSTNYALDQGTAYKNLNNATSGALNGYTTNKMNEFNGIVSADNNAGSNLYNEYQNDQGQSGDYGVNKGQYYSYNAAPTANLTNALNANQVIGYNNAQNILGGTVLNPTGGWHNGSINFDDNGYNAAVAAAQKAEADRQAAADAQAAQQAAQQAAASRPVVISGGGGGISFVCTELYRQNKISRTEACKLRIKSANYSDRVWRGYWLWSKPYSKLMRTNETATNIALHVFGNISHDTIIGKVYQSMLNIVCNICSIFTKEDNYKELTELRGRIA